MYAALRTALTFALSQTNDLRMIVECAPAFAVTAMLTLSGMVSLVVTYAIAG